MRRLSQRSVNRRRPVLTLETLEDRRVMSAGGLFAALQPFATAEASHAPFISTLTSLVAVPTDVFSSVSATVRDLGNSVAACPVKAAALDVPLNLNVDLPFLHVENLRLDLGVNPIGSDQPLLTLAAGGKIAVGPTADAPLNVAPEVQLGLGGSNIVSQGAVAPITVGAGQGILEVPPGVTPLLLSGSSTGAGLNLIPLAGNAGTVPASNSPAIPPTVIFGVPSSAALLTAPDAIGVDGGGGSGVDAALAIVPLTGTTIADGAAADVVVRPFDLGGGTDVEPVLASPDLESSGLATRFQPYSLDDAGVNLGIPLGHVGPQSGWLARLSHLAPWLTGLLAVGTALEIRRRRRRAAKGVAPLPE